MDTLPKSKTLPIEPLTRIFKNTSATYKFYWFMGILDLYVKSGVTRMNIWDIMVEMTVNAWYPVSYFRLSFGKSDSLRDAIISLQEVHRLPMNSSLNELRRWLQAHKNDTQVRHTLAFLPKNVPYWFMRPWIDIADTKEIMLRSQSLENNCLYKLTKEDDTIWVELNTHWLPYLKENYVILKDYAYWNLSSFLQVRNPNVPNIANKLVKVESRQALTRQRNYWDFVIDHSSKLTCIYTDHPIMVGDYDLDHFIPWSFVSHNLLWNLIPADVSVNSSKSNRLPDLEQYLLKLATTQQRAVSVCINENYRGQEILEDYITLGCTPQELIEMDRNSLLNCFARTFNPMSQIAQNMGFEIWKN
ncbi:MAG: HNH endonuclease [Bacteroidales bacterium]|nr:HNH endonuclease [Bacteroidales bacterium]